MINKEGGGKSRGMLKFSHLFRSAAENPFSIQTLKAANTEVRFLCKIFTRLQLQVKMQKPLQKVPIFSDKKSVLISIPVI